MTLELHDYKEDEYLQSEFESAAASETYNSGADFKRSLDPSSFDTLCIGLAGDPDNGKSEWVDGFIEADNSYIKTQNSTEFIKEFIGPNNSIMIQVDILGLLNKDHPVEILNHIQDREDLKYLIIEHADYAPEIKYDAIVEIQKNEIKNSRLIRLHCEKSMMSSDLTLTPT